MPIEERRHTVQISEHIGTVSALSLWPDTLRAAIVLGHGAGAGMEHPFMTGIAQALARAALLTVRYQFPYTQANRQRPDPPAVLQATVKAACAFTRELVGELPLIMGGKSMGGRISADVVAQGFGVAQDVRGLLFLGFPLHAPKQANLRRAEKLSAVHLPMLFLQGSKDKLAEITLMRSVCNDLGARARLVVIDDADHGFATPKRRNLPPEGMWDLLTEHTVTWLREACGV